MSDKSTIKQALKPAMGFDVRNGVDLQRLVPEDDFSGVTDIRSLGHVLRCRRERDPHGDTGKRSSQLPDGAGKQLKDLRQQLAGRS